MACSALYGLPNLVTQPTCYKGDNPTLIDVTLVSNPRRYIGNLNASFGLSDHHNIIGAATRRFTPKQQPRKIFCRSYEHFNECEVTNDIATAPYHVAYIFDDVDDTAWFHASLIKDIIDSHAPVKTKIIRKESVPFMNSKLRKAQYKRNMTRNKFRRFCNKYWNENRRQRNNVVKIWKQSLKNYFGNHCKKHDKNFWKVISPFMSDKRYRNGNSIILNENDKIVNDPSQVAEIFNEFFTTVASDIGSVDEVISAGDAIHRHKDHPSVYRKFNKSSTKLIVISNLVLLL